MTSESKPDEEKSTIENVEVEIENNDLDKDANDDDDANSNGANQPPLLQPADGQQGQDQGQDSRPPSRRQSPSESENEDEEFEDDDDFDDNFPSCYPDHPPIVEPLPEIAYPDDVTRSSPSERNLDFNRMVRNNFVPFSKGLKGDAYRRRTNYEHQQIMGYVIL